MSPPLVSVILPARDAELTIDAALNSLLNQTFTAFEVIVIDDGSTDGTAARLRAFAAKDARVRIVDGGGKGVTAALIAGTALATGRYIARQDADDVSMPDRFERQVRYLDAHPEIAALGTAATTIDEQGAEIGPFPTRHGPAAVREGLRSISATPVHGSMMIRRECLAAVGGYRAAFQSCQDFDLWLRLLERWELDNLREPLYRWRLTAGSAYGARRAAQLMYGGIAAAFADERKKSGADSYAALEAVHGDPEAFADRYPFAGPLRACWGELLLRGLNDPRLAHRHLSGAVKAGVRNPRTLALWAWTGLGLPWIGGQALRAEPPRPS